MLTLRLLLTRLLLAIATLVLVSAVIFCMLEILPGDVASRILGKSATSESLILLRAKLNLGAPAWVRYADWLGGFLTGDLGNSLVNGRPVSEILMPRLINTFWLSLFAFIIHIPLTLFPAVAQVIRRDRALDHGISLITLVLLSLPEFLLGTLLLITFVVVVPILPALSIVDESSDIYDYLLAMTLPAVTLALVMAGYAVRMLRDNLIDVLDSDYVRMAELKGLSRYRVLLRHALPNALTPTLNVTALNIAYLVGGVVVVEKVFSYNGFGSLLVDALQLRDLPLIEATIMLAAFIYIFANLAADIGSIFLNPRIRNA
jgi:peptide/nickel transport system permease protein